MPSEFLQTLKTISSAIMIGVRVPCFVWFGWLVHLKWLIIVDTCRFIILDNTYPMRYVSNELNLI